MTPDTIREVQTSFRAVAAISDAAADIFYDKLFAADPTLRALFPSDLAAQKKKLMQALAFAVGSLDRADALLPTLRQLGARHAGYGVTPEHYQTVGSALIDTLDTGLGDAFTPQCRRAWTDVYGVVAATMQEGAAEVADAA
ncbi:globin family protein [Tropicimonas marinistellae]|uniref:globin family protein n=1 Tax=Tropicimonas marinistellae TaxID=1739787 RepID=UPI0008325B1C|nr:globin family protein [Tropicimonas marinistellae]